jgi:hypothetical protein
LPDKVKTNKDICGDYGPCKKTFIKNFGELTGEWYFISATPVRKCNDNEGIVSDIIQGIDITTYNGSVIENDDGKGNKNTLSAKIQNVISQLEEKTFIVAIYDNKSLAFKGQPLAICIDPLITFIDFPYHPHLNAAGKIYDTFIPPTICYTDNPENLGNLFGDRIYDAMHYITIWLYRHQIFEVFYSTYGDIKWIGLEVKDRLDNHVFVNQLNPFGDCHCGSGTKYVSCCLNKDMIANLRLNAKGKKIDSNLIKYDPLILKKKWERNYLSEQNRVVNRLLREFNKLK